MKLEKSSIEWAIKHLITLSDSDLFPRPFELDIIAGLGDEAVSLIHSIDITNHNPSASRRFIVPKDELSYRAATQLSPLDSILLASLIYQYGDLIEKKRRPVDEYCVFSYRFKPNNDGHFWDSRYSWNDFWNECYKRSNNYSYAVVLDISDFYNQIYHHTIENQLFECGLPNQAVKWIIRLLESITVKVSRGIPIGPHSAHLLAEASIRPVDNSILSRGYHFCRFVDDIIIFVNSKIEANKAIFDIAGILDKQQRLMLQKKKTKVLDRENFQNYCLKMIEDRPINDIEKNILNIIRKYSGGNPYSVVLLSQISDKDLELFTPGAIEKILNDYLSEEEPDYVRLRWFIRRLSQVGHPSAINFCINNIERLISALSEVCHYFVSVGNHPDTNWLKIGEKLLDLLNHDIIKINEYFQISIISLFNRKVELNHVDKLIRAFDNSSPNVRREIILSALFSDSADWLRELKEQFSSMDSWNKKAFLAASAALPYEERTFFVKSIDKNDILNQLLIKWVKQK